MGWDPAEDDVRVGDGDLGAALAVAERTGSAPADCGPTFRVPSGESQAIEPPPAPTVTTSIMGILLGNAPTRALGGQRRLAVDHDATRRSTYRRRRW